jgi:hypothetical protein
VRFVTARSENVVLPPLLPPPPVPVVDGVVAPNVHDSAEKIPVPREVVQFSGVDELIRTVTVIVDRF